MFFGTTSSATVQEVASDVFSNTDAILVDVRSPAEYAAGHAKGAKNIPFSILSKEHMDELRTIGSVYVICQTGGRSSVVTSELIRHGIHAINVLGGTSMWASKGLPME